MQAEELPRELTAQEDHPPVRDVDVVYLLSFVSHPIGSWIGYHEIGIDAYLSTEKRT